MRYSKQTITTISLFISFLLGGMELTISGSLNDVIANYFNVTSLASLIVSIYLFGNVFGSFLLGYLTDKFGRKRILEFSLLIFAVSAIFITLSLNFYIFSIFQFLQGFAIGGDSSVAAPLIIENSEKNRRGLLFSLVSTVWFLGDMIASILGIFLLTNFPSSLAWRLSYAFAIFIVIPFIFVRYFLKESNIWEKYGKSKVKIPSRMKINLLLFILIASIDTIVTYIFPFIILPDFIGPFLNLSSVNSALFTDNAILLATISSIIGGFTIVPLLLTKLARIKSTIIGHTYMLIGFFITLFLVMLKSEIGIILSFAVISFLSPLGLFSISLLSVESFPSSLRGKINGIIGGVSSVVGAISPIIFYNISAGLNVIDSMITLNIIIFIAILGILMIKTIDTSRLSAEELEEVIQKS